MGLHAARLCLAAVQPKSRDRLIASSRPGPQPIHRSALPLECVSLDRPGLENHCLPRGRRGAGNVRIGFIDFHNWSFPRPHSVAANFEAAIFAIASAQTGSNRIGLTQLSVARPPRRMSRYTRAAGRWSHPCPRGERSLPAFERAGIPRRTFRRRLPKYAEVAQDGSSCGLGCGSENHMAA